MFDRRCVLVILGAIIVGMIAAGSCLAQDADDRAARVQPLGGAPIVEARRQAIAVDAFDRPLDAATIARWMQITSRCTIAEFELFLGPLSPVEAKLMRKVEQTPAPIVNRLHFDHLRGVLRNRGIIALELEEESRHKQIPHTTPAIENLLFDAFDCVYASVGPPNGSPRYGDVIIRLKDSVREKGWATPFSGMHFLSAVRHQPAAKMQDLLESGQSLPTSPTSPLSLGFDDRLHYSHYIVTEEHWNQALAYQAVLVLRNLDDSASSDRVRERLQRMLKAKRPAAFWAEFIPARETGLSPAEEAARVPFGYLEAKFPGRVTIDYFTSIEVPTDKLDEVRRWPEAEPFLKIIRAKRSDVP